MAIEIKTPIGDAFDKLSILEIKLENVKDEVQKQNIQNELNYLQDKLQPFWNAGGEELKEIYDRLKKTNGQMWVIEDSVRLKEKDDKFDEEFIELARAVYYTNDRRAAEKKEINHLLNSEFFEEKIYQKYD
jgi:hypothetical protein|tara:strand:+ start:696 stop:1088 length:393 start_codon:yes stop_codon:yes gene_type:complete